jgi:Flp pilus assembly secretin CpaC
MPRKKRGLHTAILLALAGTGALSLRPRENPHALEALEAMRGLVEVSDEANAADVGAMREDPKTQINLEVCIAILNLADAPTGLFAGSEQELRITTGRVSAVNRFEFMQRVQGLRTQTVLRHLSLPNVATVAGREAQIIAETTSVGILDAWTSELASKIRFRGVGVQVSLLPWVAPDGKIVVKTECEFSRIARMEPTTTPNGPALEPIVESVRSSRTLTLTEGETVLLAGMTQERIWHSELHLPFLSELPGIGSWFCLKGERKVDAELLVIATPRKVCPTDPPKMFPLRLWQP